MSNKLSLTINNFGPINNADLEIDKITVIVGDNSTGKSTSSKLLFCLLTVASMKGNNLANNYIKVRFVSFFRYWSNKLANKKKISFNIEEMLISPLDNESLNNELFEKIYVKTKDLFDNLEFNEKQSFFKDLETIHELIALNRNVNVKYWNVLKALIESEYASSFNQYRNSNIKRKINNL